MKKHLRCNLRRIRPLHHFPTTFLIFVVFLFACDKYRDDFDFDKLADPEWNPELALPLIKSQLTIHDFFSDSGNLMIKVNPDQSLSFRYSGKEVLSQQAGELINIPDQEYDFDIPVSVPPIPPGFGDTISFGDEFPLNTELAGQRFDSIFMKSGLLHFSGQSNLNRDEAALKITMPNLIHLSTGEHLSVNIDLDNPEQQAWIDFEAEFDLSEYRLVFINKPGTRNTFKLNMDLYVEGDENPDLSPYGFNFDVSLTNLVFNKMYGYLGNYELRFKDSILINLFEKTIAGGLEMGPGSIDLYIDVANSFGTPLLCAADSLFVYSSINPPYYQDIYLFGQGTPNFFNVQAPGINQIGETVMTNLDLSSTNLAQAFNLSPELFYYDFMAFTNPSGDTTKQNFVLDTSRISFDVTMEVKLFTAIDRFVVTDTTDFNLENENPDEIDYLLFRVNTLNGFPLETAVQIYFTDNNNQVIDSLIRDTDQRIFAGAPTGGPPGYRVTQPALKTTDIKVTSSRLDKILTADNMILKAWLSTTNEELAIIYEDYSITLNIGLITGISINPGGDQ
ncbi:MAG: hypothetical protein ACOCX8_00225 [Bacteroidota bacterium]